MQEFLLSLYLFFFQSQASSLPSQFEFVTTLRVSLEWFPLITKIDLIVVIAEVMLIVHRYSRRRQLDYKKRLNSCLRCHYKRRERRNGTELSAPL